MASASLLTSSNFRLSSFKFHTNESLMQPRRLRFRRSNCNCVVAVSSTAERNKSRYGSSIAISSSSSDESLYQVLGIHEGATQQEIKSAYRSLARLMHPDVASSNESSAEDFIRISRAYTTLSDAEKRADYDHQMLRTRSMYYSTSAIGSRYSGSGNRRPRSWETDQCW